MAQLPAAGDRNAFKAGDGQTFIFTKIFSIRISWSKILEILRISLKGPRLTDQIGSNNSCKGRICVHFLDNFWVSSLGKIVVILTKKGVKCIVWDAKFNIHQASTVLAGNDDKGFYFSILGDVLVFYLLWNNLGHGIKSKAIFLKYCSISFFSCGILNKRVFSAWEFLKIWILYIKGNFQNPP